MFPALTLAVALAMGVGAADSNTLIVRIDGKETRVTVAGVSAGSERGTAFAQCLVAGRVLRISGPHSAAKVTLLDDSIVSAHIAEFLQSQTSADPCALGKAAYQPRTGTPVAALPAVTPKKKPRVLHVSFAGGEMSKSSVQMPAPLPTTVTPVYTPQAAPARTTANQPTYANPVTVQTYTPPTAGAYAPQTVSTTSGLAPTTTQALPQQGTEQIPQQQTETVPTTTYAPRPPL